jgi:hypothetical protein
MLLAIPDTEKVLQSRSLFRDFVGLLAVVDFIAVGKCDRHAATQGFPPHVEG